MHPTSSISPIACALNFVACAQRANRVSVWSVRQMFVCVSSELFRIYLVQPLAWARVLLSVVKYTL